MTVEAIREDEVAAFLDANPAVRLIDIVLFDLNGMPRGKRVRRDDLAGFARNGLLLPASVYVLDPRGNSIAETGRLWETGDCDIRFRILSGTLVPVPVNDGQMAQAVMVPETPYDLCSHTILSNQVARLKRMGFTASVAVELEFYVTQRSADGTFALAMPPGLSSDPDKPMTFMFEALDALDPFVNDTYRIAAAQGLPVDAVMQESGPGQFEINLKYRDDPVAAALDGLLLKRAIKVAARQHGLEATFMPKPHHDWTGSGMHIHASLRDSSGKNAFVGDPLSPLCRQAIGGLQQTMADFMAVWAQSANAYKRYVPESYVPLSAHWGLNNRTVALRIPFGEGGAATRIEHRVGGADANPMLAVAGVLAGMAHGIENTVEPTAPVEGTAEEAPAGTGGPELPLTWAAALTQFQRSAVVRDVFGADAQDVFYKLKTTERLAFERVVTTLDYDWYAQVC